MRILLAPSGSRGDFQPLLALSIGLKAAGHSVLLASSPCFSKEAEAFDIDFRPVGMNVEQWLRQNQFRMSPMKASLELLKAGRKELLPQMKQLAPLAAKADLVVGAGAQISAPSVADAAGVPYYYVAYTTQLFPSTDYPPIFLPFPGLPRWGNYCLWWLAYWIVYCSVNFVLAKAHRELGMDPPRDFQDHFIRFDSVLLATDPEIMTVPPDSLVDFTPTGAFRLKDGRSLPEEVEEFLEHGSKPLYIGFGSMSDPHPERTTKLILEAVQRVGCRVILSSGWAGFGDAELGKNILVIGPSSHARLFPQMAGVIHHGGAGTTAAAAHAGVPQCVIPHAFDQYLYADNVHGAGLGPKPVRRTHLNVDRLETILSQLIEGQYNERARAVGRSIRTRDGVSNAIELLTRSTHSPSTSPRSLPSIPPVVFG